MYFNTFQHFPTVYKAPTNDKNCEGNRGKGGESGESGFVVAGISSKLQNLSQMLARKRRKKAKRNRAKRKSTETGKARGKQQKRGIYVGAKGKIKTTKPDEGRWPILCFIPST